MRIEYARYPETEGGVGGRAQEEGELVLPFGPYGSGANVGFPPAISTTRAHHWHVVLF